MSSGRSELSDFDDGIGVQGTIDVGKKAGSTSDSLVPDLSSNASWIDDEKDQVLLLLVDGPRDSLDLILE